MKQLLIVKSNQALNAGASTPKDLSSLHAGAISFFELGADAFLSAAPTKNFGIALGRNNNSPAFVIPEVDINTLEISVAKPIKGYPFYASITVPTVAAGKTYTLVLIKKGTVPHERNTWSATETIAADDATTTAANIAAKLRAYFKAMSETGSLPITVGGTGATVTLTGANVGEGWELKAADDLAGTSISGVVASDAVGDKKYIQELASKCAAGKGFTDVDVAGRDIYPGYPEDVEDPQLSSNGDYVVGSTSSDLRKYSSGHGYVVFTLRFQVGRDSAKTRDEKVWQVVHIAVPIENASYSTIAGILPEGRFINNLIAEAAGS